MALVDIVQRDNFWRIGMTTTFIIVNTRRAQSGGSCYCPLYHFIAWCRHPSLLCQCLQDARVSEQQVRFLEHIIRIRFTFLSPTFQFEPRLKQGRRNSQFVFPNFVQILTALLEDFRDYRKSYTARNRCESLNWIDHMPEFSPFLPLLSLITRTSSFFWST